MGLYGGVDLHGNNGYYGLIDENDRRVFKKRLGNDLSEVLGALEPYRGELEEIAVESTYNWYWLVDGLMENGYDVRLANPSKMQQYSGMKDANDQTDAFWVAHLLRLGILPEGHIYNREERPVRDLLRRRILLVQQRTSHLLSFQALMVRQTGEILSCNEIKKLSEEDVKRMLAEKHLVLMGETNIAVIEFLTERIRKLEQAALKRGRLKPEFKGLLSIPGIGKILALTIMMETGDIGRFPQVGNYSSYCRCVKAHRISNGKKKGLNNRKNGNKYLGWAYVEAANYMKRYYKPATSWYQRKRAKTMQVVATKALASKISKAAYYVMRDQVAFDGRKIFG